MGEIMEADMKTALGKWAEDEMGEQGRECDPLERRDGGNDVRGKLGKKGGVNEELGERARLDTF